MPSPTVFVNTTKSTADCIKAVRHSSGLNCLFFIGSTKQIIKRNVKVIRKSYQGIVIRFPVKILISGNAVLIHI